ncbi:MAG: choice-of-anchor J domain-containing protein [Bacteroides sp.]|nr:choice-of-anchor J domain-containing protein [Bacteroides sp.]
MKTYHLLKSLSGLTISALILCGSLAAQKPESPKNLKVDTVIGHQVSLSWENPDEGEILFESGFEKQNAADSNAHAFEQGWTVKTTNNSHYACSWFNYPADEFWDMEDYTLLIHNGKKSAAIFPDPEEGGHPMHQDEWLISPTVPGAAYLKFYHFIDPQVLIDGANPDFPDHYTVIVSTDGGETWSDPIWDARYDASPEGGWQEVNLSLAAYPTDKMKVAFRAYGDFKEYEDGDTVNQSLYAVWAIDDVQLIKAARQASADVLFNDNFESADNDDNENPEFGEQWSLKQYELSEEDAADADFTRSWFRNPLTGNEEIDEMFASMTVNGERSAMILPDNAGLPQDEWLISSTIVPQANKKLSLQFSYMSNAVYSEEDEGSNETFVFGEGSGNFVVLLSKDDGTTWQEEPIWNMADDNKGSMKDEMFYINDISLTIDALPSDKVKIAFRAYGDQMEEESGEKGLTGLAAIWAIDDIRIVSGEGSPLSTIDHYKITLDGKDLTDISGISFVDNSKKNAGEHTYAVYSVTKDGTESEPATVRVKLDSLVFAAPENFTCISTLEESTGKYTVTMTWDAPEGKFKPVSYTIYNGNILFAVDQTDENGQEGIGMTGCFGVYQFSIVALYESPDGESEPVVQNLALGVRFGVNGLQAEQNGKDVVLTWNEPYESEFKVASYTVYRGDEKVADGIKDLTYRDAAVADGLYQYTVIAVYEDNVESVRASVSQQVGEKVRVSLPYAQNFNTTFCPANWQVVNHSIRTPDRYGWYFDDRSRLGVKGDDFAGCYAAIDCLDAKGYTRDASLELPPIDLSSVQNRGDITLSFHYSYATGGSFKAGTEWSVDGEEWYILEMLDKENGFIPGDDGDFHIQRANHCIGADEAIKATVDTAKTLYLRFHYTATMSNFLAIDNVLVSADKVAIEKNAEDFIDVTVSSSNGLMSVRASHNIKHIEVFSIQGIRMADLNINAGKYFTMPIPQKGVAIVRVSTERGSKVVKVLL